MSEKIILKNGKNLKLFLKIQNFLINLCRNSIGANKEFPQKSLKYPEEDSQMKLNSNQDHKLGERFKTIL